MEARVCEQLRTELPGNLGSGYFSHADSPNGEEESLWQELLVVCAWCKRLRDSSNGWHHAAKPDAALHSASRISHGICPACFIAQVRSSNRAAG